VIAELNDYQFQYRPSSRAIRLARPWRTPTRPFIGLDGTLRIDFRDGAVTDRAGDITFVPSVEHKPVMPIRGQRCC